MLGPAPLFRLRGRERFQVVLKTTERAPRDRRDRARRRGRRARPRAPRRRVLRRRRPAIDSVPMADEEPTLDKVEPISADRDAALDPDAARRYGDPVARAQRRARRGRALRRARSSEEVRADGRADRTTRSGSASPPRSSASCTGCSSTASSPTRRWQAVVNPVLEWSGERARADEEGCLSIPDVLVDVERALRVRMRGFDAGGRDRRRGRGSRGARAPARARPPRRRPDARPRGPGSAPRRATGHARQLDSERMAEEHVAGEIELEGSTPAARPGGPRAPRGRAALRAQVRRPGAARAARWRSSASTTRSSRRSAGWGSSCTTPTGSASRRPRSA